MPFLRPDLCRRARRAGLHRDRRETAAIGAAAPRDGGHLRDHAVRRANPQPIAPQLERYSGLRAGSDFLAFSQEMVTGPSPTSRATRSRSAASTQPAPRGPQFYASRLQFDERPDLAEPNGVGDMGSAEAAELAETTFRDVTSGWPTSSLYTPAGARWTCTGWVIEACNSQPFSHLRQPGIAVGASGPR